MKDMGQSASRDALAPQINEPHQPAVSNSEQGALKIINDHAYTPYGGTKIIELRVRAMLDPVPGAWHDPQDLMRWIAGHNYVQDVELVDGQS